VIIHCSSVSGVSFYYLGAGPIPGRKRHHSTWLETDLDSLLTLDHGLDSPASPQHQTSPPGSKIQPASSSVDSIPEASLYINTESSSKQIGNNQVPEKQQIAEVMLDTLEFKVGKLTQVWLKSRPPLLFAVIPCL
jgi:hypothetical protein